MALFTTRASNVRTRDITWLYEPYIPYRKITLFEGDPEVGKSWFAFAIAAHISRGKRLPQLGADAVKGRVLIASVEDEIDDAIVPRLKLLGANLKNIIMEDKAFGVEDTDEVKKAIMKYKAKLVILDPLHAYFDPSKDPSKANQVRSMMTKLKQIAADTDCAIIGIRHLAKGNSGLRAMYRGSGSIDWIAASRSALQFIESDGKHYACLIKGNYAPYDYRPPIEYKFTKSKMRPFKIIGPDESLVSSDLLEPRVGRSNKPRVSAMRALIDYLEENGPTPWVQIVEEIDASEKTLERARTELQEDGVVRRITKGKNHFWAMADV